MRSCWYIIIESLGQWWVDCEGKAFGPFLAPEEATRAARRIAVNREDADRDAQIWISGADGQHKMIWSAARYDG